MCHLEWSLEWSQMIWGRLEWPGCEGEVVIRLLESVDELLLVFQAVQAVQSLFVFRGFKTGL